MRNYKKETKQDALNKKRLVFKVDRQKWQALTPDEQEQIKTQVKAIIQHLK